MSEKSLAVKDAAIPHLYVDTFEGEGCTDDIKKTQHKNKEDLKMHLNWKSYC